MSMAPPPVILASAAETNMLNSGSSVECSTSPSLMNSSIKQEKRDDRAKIEKLSPRQQTPTIPIAFSITNILSNNFGNAKMPSNNNQISLNNNKVLSEKKNSVLFRPYNDDCGENGAASPKKSKVDRRQRSDDEESNGESKISFSCLSFVRLKIHENRFGNEFAQLVLYFVQNAERMIQIQFL